MSFCKWSSTGSTPKGPGSKRRAEREPECMLNISLSGQSSSVGFGARRVPTFRRYGRQFGRSNEVAADTVWQFYRRELP